ncbi:MAG: ABC transporter substrate-binding protein [Betaproteobacteria bacterium]|nr:ABC transporter substrate-binding protein [Betaproteobacteria bacterium]
MKTIAHMAGALALLVAFGAQAQNGAPDALVKGTVSEVLAAIKQTRDPRALAEFAERKLLAYFDFKEMTRMAVGRAWAQASAAQQQALERVFRTLLMRTYTTALALASGDQTVEVRPVALRPGDTDATVRTLVKEPGKKPVPMDYRMSSTPGGWKVYDVVVENLSIVTNYRNSFNSEIARSGIDGLIRVIETKNQKQEG